MTHGASGPRRDAPVTWLGQELTLLALRPAVVGSTAETVTLQVAAVDETGRALVSLPVTFRAAERGLVSVEPVTIEWAT